MPPVWVFEPMLARRVPCPGPEFEDMIDRNKKPAVRKARPLVVDRRKNLGLKKGNYVENS